MKNLTSTQWIAGLVALALSLGSLGWMISIQGDLSDSAKEGKARRQAAADQ